MEWHPLSPRGESLVFPQVSCSPLRFREDGPFLTSSRCVCHAPDMLSPVQCWWKWRVSLPDGTLKARAWFGVFSWLLLSDPFTVSVSGKKQKPQVSYCRLVPRAAQCLEPVGRGGCNWTQPILVELPGPLSDVITTAAPTHCAGHTGLPA